MNRLQTQHLGGSGTIGVGRWSLRSITQRIARHLAVVLVFVSACSSSGNVKVYPVKGRVTFAGKPMVGGGSISFIPKNEQAGKTAGGIIQPDGTYVLGTYSEADGSMAGDFRVIITQQTVKEPEPTPDGSPPTAASTLSVAPADRIPIVYANDRESPLTAKVEPKPNEINFDLQPK